MFSWDENGSASFQMIFYTPFCALIRLVLAGPQRAEPHFRQPPRSLCTSRSERSRDPSGSDFLPGLFRAHAGPPHPRCSRAMRMCRRENWPGPRRLRWARDRLVAVRSSAKSRLAASFIPATGESCSKTSLAIMLIGRFGAPAGSYQASWIFSRFSG